MNEYLRHYTVAVKHPDVSGFEHLEMLMIRDKIAKQVNNLSEEEKEQLKNADQQLLVQSDQFHHALSQITNLQSERQRRQPPPNHWWWYLDVLTQLPARPQYPQRPKLQPM